MVDPVRTPGLRGRLPAKVGGQKLAIGWAHNYLTNPLPAPTYPVDVTGGVTDWRMLGNGPDDTLTVNGGQPVGDCTFAGREHYRMAKAAAGGETVTWETADALVTEYLAYNHGQDVGANIADLLLSWYRDGTILAFAPVDLANRTQADALMAAFHGLYVGVSLTDDADALFAAGKPWTVSQGQRPNPAEGHCIVRVRADGRQDTYVTWGALQRATTGWSRSCVGEAWVVITAEDAAAASLNVDALRADIDALGGTGGQPAPPEPTPAPQPKEIPVPNITRQWAISTAEQAVVVFLLAFLAPMVLSGAGAFNLTAVHAGLAAAGAAVLSFLQSALAGLISPPHANVVSAVRARATGQ